MRAAVAALCLLLASSAAWSQTAAGPVVVQPPLPAAFVGHWVVTRSVGEDPAYLGTSARTMVGKPIEIGSASFKAWTVFSGTVTQMRRSSGTLRDYLSSIQSPAPDRVADGDRRFEFYLLAAKDCTSDGKRLDECPVIFTLAQDQANGEIALVTLPAGLATLGPAAAPDPGPTKRQ